MPPIDHQIDEIIPAVEALDAALLQSPPHKFTPETVHETAAEIATEHNIPTDELLKHFTLFLVISTPTQEDNTEFYNNLVEYLTTHYS